MRFLGLCRESLRSCDGQATAEFALVFPLLMIIFLLFAQAVMVLRAQLIVTGAAREAARKGVETPNEALIKGAAYQASQGLDPKRMKIEVVCAKRNRGEPITVRVRYEVPLYLPILEKFFPSEIGVTGESTMRIENDRV